MAKQLIQEINYLEDSKQELTIEEMSGYKEAIADVLKLVELQDRVITLELLEEQYNDIDLIFLQRKKELSKYLQEIGFESNILINKSQSIVNLSTRLDLIKDQIRFLKG